MKFVNLTPHAITVRPDGGIQVVIPASGTVARCQVASERVTEIEGIPVVRQVFGTPVGIPEPVEGIVYIASTLVAQAAGRGGATWCRPIPGRPRTAKADRSSR